MAIVNVTAMTEDTSPSGDDLIYVVHDPAGTPAPRKVKLSNLYKSFADGVLIPSGENFQWGSGGPYLSDAGLGDRVVVSHWLICQGNRLSVGITGNVGALINSDTVSPYDAWYDSLAGNTRLRATTASCKIFFETQGAERGSCGSDGWHIVGIDFRVETDNQESALLVDASADTVSVAAGLSTGQARLGGRYFSSTTETGNTGTGEDDLISATALPANALSANGKAVRIRAVGTSANNSNAKTVKLYAGASVIGTLNLSVNTAANWVIDAEIIRTGSGTQIYHAEIKESDTPAEIGVGDLTLDDAASITIKVTGEAVDDDDILCRSLVVDFVN